MSRQSLGTVRMNAALHELSRAMNIVEGIVLVKLDYNSSCVQISKHGA